MRRVSTQATSAVIFRSPSRFSETAFVANGNVMTKEIKRKVAERQ
jgi:hypothetical protein